MTILTLDSPPPPELADALAEFEQSFLYPLGSNQKFRISHGKEYLPFFRAMGEVTLMVAEHEGNVLGTVVLVRRIVRIHSASGAREEPAYYLCDLKLRPEWRQSPLLVRLIKAVMKHILDHGGQRCYGVVMDGTARLPTDYTGRLGVPLLGALGEIMIMRLTPRAPLPSWDDSVQVVCEEQIEDCCRARRGHGVSAFKGFSAERSLMTPIGLMDSSGQACGKLEDTRLGKRLFLQSGEELLSAHLSNWAWADARLGANILLKALAISIQQGYQALFAAIPRESYPQLVPHLQQIQVQEAPATVFGAGFALGQDWWIDTAEI